MGILPGYCLEPYEYLGIYRNTCAAIGIPGNLEAGEAYLGSHGNTWAAIGIPGNLEAGDTCYRNTGEL